MMLGCSIRALWILNPHSQVLFSRRFPTVERQWQAACKTQAQISNITAHPLPTDSQLAQALADRKNREGSIRGSGIRDALSKEGSDSWVDDPITRAFSVAQVLGDVVAGEVVEPEIYTNSASTMSGLLDSITGGIGITSITARAKPVNAPVAAVTTAVSAAAGTSSTVVSGSANKSTLKTADREALRSFISSAMPFGTPLDLNPINITSIRLNGFTSQDIPPADQKQPAWKPYLYRGKQRILFALHEVITAALYDRDDVADVISLGGQVLCRADLEGLPDITLPLSCPTSAQFDALTFHPCAQTFEQGLEKQTITFSPPLGNFILARYVSSSCAIRPPLQGFYQLSMVSEDEGAFLFRLKLMEGYKAPMTMEHCSLSIPFPRRKIVAVDGVPSVGTVTSTEHSIEWKIVVSSRGLTSKSIETTFSGTVKFASKTDPLAKKNVDVPSEEDSDDELGNSISSDHRDALEAKLDKADIHLAAADWEEPFCWEAYSYAKASLKLVGGTLSGLSVDPKTVTIYPTTKAASEYSAQVVSGEYIFWNSLGRYPSAASPPT
ncbi:hypothetical protein O6H91_02G023100 [Diphasiastrum complanatum]|uniref:Uncharacterized protein n=1 Tax=Diphasiastrum complanatum TaxID=34168 RepID=A0ACC2EDI6_DIPCM|nr:hypothetical protein O6H91_02G023100 [Diphasiastrum complanatum]